MLLRVGARNLLDLIFDSKMEMFFYTRGLFFLFIGGGYGLVRRQLGVEKCEEVRGSGIRSVMWVSKKLAPWIVVLDELYILHWYIE